MSLSTKVVSNTIYLFFDWFVLTLFSFFYGFVIVKMLTPEAYGIVATSVSIMTLFSVICLSGFSTAVTKLIPEYFEKKQNKKITSLIKFSMKVILVFGAFLFVVLILVAPQLASVLKVTNEVIWFIAFGLVFLSLANFFGSILYGFQNMKKIFKADLCGQAFKVVVSSILILLGFGFYGPLFGIVASFLVFAFLKFERFWFSYSSGIELNKKEVVLMYALPAFVATLAGALFGNVPYIILTILKNPEITGLFAIAMMLVSPASIIPTTLSSALFPIMSQLCADHDAKKRQSYLSNLVLRYALFFSLPIMIFLLFFSKPLVLIISKPQFVPAIQLFPILSIAAVIFGCGNIFLNNLYAIGKTKIHRNITVISAIMFLVLSIPFTYFFSAFGLAASYLLSVLTLLLLSYSHIKKYLKLSIQFKNIFKILVSSLVFFLVCYIADILSIDFIVKLVFVGLGSLTYLFSLLILKFYIKEDAKILEFIAGRTPIFGKELKSLSRFLFKYV